MTTLNSAAHIRQKSSVICVVGYNDSSSAYIDSSESCQLKIFVPCWNKVERKYIQEHQPNQFYCYSQNMGFVSRIDQNVVKYRNGIRIKKGGGPRLF